jgi:iron complex outermembrane receptor protein
MKDSSSKWRSFRGARHYQNRNFWGATLRLDKQFGNVDLLSITDYQHATKFYIEDTDGTPLHLTTFDTGMRLNQYSQEFRLSGKSSRNTWTLGAFGMIIDGHYFGSYNEPFLDYFPVTNWSQKTKFFAFFAQDEYALTDKLKLIGGLRYWHDNRNACYHGSDSYGTVIDFCKNNISYSATPDRPLGEELPIRKAPNHCRSALTLALPKAVVPMEEGQQCVSPFGIELAQISFASAAAIALPHLACR